jgi:ribosome-binding factor A
VPPPRYRRTDRVAALLLREVTRIVREDVHDPRIGFVTFTGADVSPDLANARVFVSVMGTDAEKDAAVEGLRSAAGFIRNRLWDLLDLKSVPELAFHLDRTLERAGRIEAILDRIHGEAPPAAAARDVPPEEPSSGAAEEATPSGDDAPSAPR